MIQVLLVDDHALFREGLARLLSAEPDMEVRHCGSAREAQSLLASQPADVILLDFDLGNESAAVFLESRRQRGDSGKVLLVTAGLSGSQAAEMRALGVVSIVPKHESLRALCQSVRELLANGEPGGQETAGPDRESRAASRRPSFTDRDREVVRAVLEGLANKQIAARLSISESAVKASLQTLFAKMGVRSRGQLVRAALEEFRSLLGAR